MHKVLLLCYLLYTGQVVCLLFPSYASTRDNRDEDDEDGNQNHNDGGDLKGDNNEGNKEEEISAGNAPLFTPNVQPTPFSCFQSIQNAGLRIATGPLKMASIDHLHTEAKMLEMVGNVKKKDWVGSPQP